MAEAEIAIVVSPRDWAERLHRFVADHGGARVRARVLGAREALDDSYSVLVVEDLTSFLTPRLVDELHRRGRRVLGVYDVAEPWGRERLIEVGVDETLPGSAPPEEFVRTIEALAAGLALDDELSRLVDAGSSAPPVVTPVRRGAIIAVGGASGGVGATEVAIALTAALRPVGAVLVDADDVAPAVAQRLGLPLHPNLRTAVDVVAHRSGPVERAVLTADGDLAVVSGLPTSGAWHELRAGEVLDAVAELAAAFPHVVVNVAPTVEDLEPFGGPPRFGLARTLLAAADVLVGVTSPTPVGVARLVAWAADVRTLAPVAPLQVVVNRTPPGRFRRAEVEQEVRRSVTATAFGFLPSDRRVEQAAWDGTLVRGGPFPRGVEALAEAVRGAAHQRVSGAGQR